MQEAIQRPKDAETNIRAAMFDAPLHVCLETYGDVPRSQVPGSYMDKASVRVGDVVFSKDAP